MKELDYFVLSLLASLVLACALFSGCAHSRKSVELQCVGPSSLQGEVEGPVIIKDGEMVWYDAKHKLRKTSGVCGIRGIPE